MYVMFENNGGCSSKVKTHFITIVTMTGIFDKRLKIYFSDRKYNFEE